MDVIPLIKLFDDDGDDGDVPQYIPCLKLGQEYC